MNVSMKQQQVLLTDYSKIKLTDRVCSHRLHAHPICVLSNELLNTRIVNSERLSSIQVTIKFSKKFSTYTIQCELKENWIR